MLEVWSLGIPVPPEQGDLLNKLILGIAEKEATLGVDKKLTRKITPKLEFHVTIGVFKPGLFQTSGSLFRHLFNYLHKNSGKLKELQDMFKGRISIDSIGYSGKTIASSQAVWVTVTSPQTHAIREKIHNLMRFAGVKDSHFIFSDPHLTLYTQAGKGDLHNIPKPPKLPLKGFIKGSKIAFNFQQVSLYQQNNIVLTFGKKLYNGRPENKFKTMLQAEMKSRRPAPIYNLGNLFNFYSRDEALIIKQIVQKDGPRGLAVKGYKVGEIMKILKAA
jgi:hypothetical protein